MAHTPNILNLEKIFFHQLIPNKKLNQQIILIKININIEKFLKQD